MDRLGDLFYEQGKQHEKHGEYVEKLGDSYVKLYEQQVNFDQQYNDRMVNMET